MTFEKELSILLNREIEAINQLLDLSKGKTEIIVANEVGKLEAIVPEEEELIKEIITLEKDRMDLLDNWGIPVDTPISKILEDVNENEDELRKIQKDLSEAMYELKERNDLNNSIMQENLDWLEFNMNLITSTEAPIQYDGDSKDKTTGDRSIFDTKA